LVEEHHHLAVYCLCTPKPYIWKETVQFHCELNLSRLKTSFIRKVCSCWSKSKSYYRIKEFYKMKKMIIHSFRYLLVAQQIVEHNNFHPVDFSVANEYYYQIINMESTDWKDYENRYLPEKEILLLKIFPQTIKLDDFLDKDLPLPVAQLKRIGKFSAYQGQEKIILLDIIRLALLSADDIKDSYPEFFQLYSEISEAYTFICQSIQSSYDQVISSERIDNSNQDLSQTRSIYGKIIEEIAGKWKSILFYMIDNNITSVIELFKRDDKKKYLEMSIFHSKKKKIKNTIT